MRVELSKAIAVQAFGAGFCAVVSFGLLVFLGRAMGPEAFGGYVSVLSTAVLGLILIEGGWPTLIYRETAAPATMLEPGAGLMRHATAHALAATAVLTALAGLLWVVSGEKASPAWMAAFACMGGVALMNLVSARLRGRGLFGREAGWQSLGRAVSAAAIIVAVLAWGPLPVGVFLAWAAGLAVVLALAGRPWLAQPQWRGLRSGYALALPFVAFEALFAVLTKGELAILGLLDLPDADLSYYAACTRLSEAGLLLFAPVGNVLLRSLRQAPDETTRRRLTSGAVLVAMLLGGAALALGTWSGPWLMPILFGGGFEPAGSLLPWVLAMLPFALANLVLFPTLLAQGRERILVGCMVAGTGLLVIGLALGSTLDGVRGAAIGTMLAQASLFALCGSAAWASLRRTHA